MLGSAVTNIAVGAGIKLVSNIVNGWIERKGAADRNSALKDAEVRKVQAEIARENAKDPFVQLTRRVLFCMLTATYCYMVIYYGKNPHISFDIIVPKKDLSGGIMSFLFGSGKEFHVVTISGGLLLHSFTEIMSTIVGFYAVPRGR
jgi:hypothetical protein